MFLAVFLGLAIALFLLKILAQQLFRFRDRHLLNQTLDLDGNLNGKPPATLENVLVGPHTIRTLVVDGPGDTIVFCHGFGAGLGVFYKSFGKLADKKYRVYAFDWPGMGFSSRFSNNLKTVDEIEDFYVEMLESWRKRMKIETMTICAHSMGGYLASVYALKYPHVVVKLILVSPAGYAVLPSKKQLQNNSTTKKVFRQLLHYNLSPLMLVRNLGLLGYHVFKVFTNSRFPQLDELEKKLVHDYLYGITVQPPSGELILPRLLRITEPGFVAHKPLPDRVKKLEKKILFMYGSEDWMDHHHALVCKHDLHHAQIVILVDATHHLYLDNSRAFTDVITCEMEEKKALGNDVIYL
jgi:cardiolipin-specific phospholipase